MKRIILLMLAFVTLITFCSCSKETGGKTVISVPPTLDQTNTPAVTIGTQTPEIALFTPTNAPTATPTPNIPSVSKKVKKILGYFDLKKPDLLKNLGKNYEKVATGAEGSYEGYFYKDSGITIVFEDDGSVAFIQCDETVNFNGAKAGMKFAEIKKKLGAAKIQETWIETPDHKAYELNYVIEHRKINFLSSEKEGNNSTVTIYKE